jgi:hypothetical protein
VQEVGLEVKYFQNFHNFKAIQCEMNVHPDLPTLLRDMRVLNHQGQLSYEEWGIC